MCASLGVQQQQFIAQNSISHRVVSMASGPPDLSTTKMQELADKAVKEKAGAIRKKLEDEHLNITCR